MNSQEGSTAFTPLKTYEIQPHREKGLKATASRKIDQEPPTMTEDKIPVIKFNRQLTINQRSRTQTRIT